MTHALVRPSKDTIRDLPIFEGLNVSAITLVANSAQLAVAEKVLSAATELGFDTESKPTFKKGETSNGPHVIQMAVADHAFLFTAHFMPGVECALRLLQREDVIKYGFGLAGDARLFRQKYSIEAKSLVDLARCLKKKAALKNDMGARAAVAMLFQQRLTKSAQRSNWSAYPLSSKQIKYAANDAYAGFLVAQKMRHLGLLDVS